MRHGGLPFFLNGGGGGGTTVGWVHPIAHIAILRWGIPSVNDGINVCYGGGGVALVWEAFCGLIHDTSRSTVALESSNNAIATYCNLWSVIGLNESPWFRALPRTSCCCRFCLSCCTYCPATYLLFGHNLAHLNYLGLWRRSGEPERLATL